VKIYTDDKGRKYTISKHPFSKLKKGDVFSYNYSYDIDNTATYIAIVINNDKGKFVVDDIVCINDGDHKIERNITFDIRDYSLGNDDDLTHLLDFKNIKVIKNIDTYDSIIKNICPEYFT